MRIIGGIQKGKQILAPKNLPVRPTTDFAKEALFNILNNNFSFDECDVLDLFCGTGNISLEFGSRGAKKIVSVDKHTPCINFVKQTCKTLQLNTIYTERADVFKFLEKANGTYDIIFADPPYELSDIHRIHELVFLKKLLNPNAWLIIEHGAKTDLTQLQHYIETRHYGNVNFSFFYTND